MTLRVRNSVSSGQTQPVAGNAVGTSLVIYVDGKRAATTMTTIRSHLLYFMTRRGVALWMSFSPRTAPVTFVVAGLTGQPHRVTVRLRFRL